MNNHRFFKASAFALCLLLLTSCAGAASPPQSVASDLAESTSPSSAPPPASLSSAPASSAAALAPRLIEVPASEPSSKALPRQGVLGPVLLPSFDGLAYAHQDYDIFNHVQAAVAGPEGVFFVGDSTLYYSDGSRIHRLMGDVYNIAGTDKDGLYLVVYDDSVTISRGTSPDDYSRLIRRSSLVHYHPVTGVITPILPNIQNAFVAGKSHDILYYATAQSSKSEYGYVLSMWRRPLPYGPDTVVFSDNFIWVNTTNGGQYSVPAKDVLFYTEPVDGKIMVDIMYPWPSCFPYDRFLLLEANGHVALDTEKQELVTQHDGYCTRFFKNNYTYSQSSPAQLGPYRLRWTEGHKWYLEQSDGEVFLGTSYDFTQQNGLLYFLPRMGFKDQGIFKETLGVYDGEQFFMLSLWENYETNLFHSRDNLYVANMGMDPDKGGIGTDCVSIYKATGTKQNPTAIQFLAAIVSEEEYFNDYMSRLYYPIGDYVILYGRTYENEEGPVDVMAVLNLADGSMAHAGTPGFQVLAAA